MDPPKPAPASGGMLQPGPDGGASAVDVIADYLGAPCCRPARTEYLIFLLVSVLLLLGLLAVIGYFYGWPLWVRYAPALADKEKISASLKAMGSWGPLVFILIVAVVVLVTVWPLPLELAGGFLFGVPGGLLYSLLGLTLGSVVAFLLGRTLEKKFVARIVGPARMKRFRRFMKREGVLAAFLTFLIPGMPQDSVCYLLSLTRMPLKIFLAAIILVRLPITFLLTLQGAQVYQGHYLTTLGLLALYLGLAALLYRRRESLFEWLNRRYPEEE